MNCTVKDISMVEITYRDQLQWAIVRIQESTGFLSIQSDYGNWSFGWPNHGRRGLANFLACQHRDYIGGKVLSPSSAAVLSNRQGSWPEVVCMATVQPVEMDRQWVAFWDRVWNPHIRPELRILAEKAA